MPQMLDLYDVREGGHLMLQTPVLNIPFMLPYFPWCCGKKAEEEPHLNILPASHQPVLDAIPLAKCGEHNGPGWHVQAHGKSFSGKQDL